jgi:hypothetical protein
MIIVRTGRHPGRIPAMVTKPLEHVSISSHCNQQLESPSQCSADLLFKHSHTADSQHARSNARSWHHIIHFRTWCSSRSAFLLYAPHCKLSAAEIDVRLRAMYVICYISAVWCFCASPEADARWWVGYSLLLAHVHLAARPVAARPR